MHAAPFGLSLWVGEGDHQEQKLVGAEGGGLELLVEVWLFGMVRSSPFPAMAVMEFPMPLLPPQRALDLEEEQEEVFSCEQRKFIMPVNSISRPEVDTQEIILAPAVEAVVVGKSTSILIMISREHQL